MSDSQEDSVCLGEASSEGDENCMRRIHSSPYSTLQVRDMD